MVVTGDTASGAVTAAIARLQTSVANDRDFGPPGQQISENGRGALINIPLVGDPDSEQARRGLDRLRSELIPESFDETNTTVLVGGHRTASITPTLPTTGSPVVLAFVLGLSFMLLTVVFRSMVLSASAVIFEPALGGCGLRAAGPGVPARRGADLLGFQQVERVEAWVPTFLFSVLFALSMDYHVFLLSRIRERYAQTRNTEEAIVHGIAATGRIITGAALIIVVVFSGFASGQLVSFQQMGFGVGVALLVDATLIRMVVVPAAMTLMGRWNWYLPGWAEIGFPSCTSKETPNLYAPAS